MLSSAIRRPGWLLVAAGALALAACSQRAPHDASLVTIVANDDGHVAPDTLPEGLNHLAFENHGSIIHECMFIRLPDGITAANYLADVDSGYDFPEGAYDCSGPGLLSPLQRVEMWLTLEPGRYLLGCWFHSHLTKVAPHTVVVSGAHAVPVTPPREDATLKLIDFRYEMTGKLHAGKQTIRVEWVGPSMHEVDTYRLEGGRSLKDLRAWYANHMQGPLPATAMGGVLDTHDLSRVVWLQRDFTAGHYVFWCDMPMIQKGKEADAGEAAHVTHADAGMVLEFDVEL